MMRTLLHFENAVLDFFEKNRISIEGAKIVLWTLLAAIYEDELIEESNRRETIRYVPIKNSLIVLLDVDQLYFLKLVMG